MISRTSSDSLFQCPEGRILLFNSGGKASLLAVVGTSFNAPKGGSFFLTNTRSVQRLHMRCRKRFNAPKGGSFLLTLDEIIRVLGSWGKFQCPEGRILLVNIDSENGSGELYVGFQCPEGRILLVNFWVLDPGNKIFRFVSMPRRADPSC